MLCSSNKNSYYRQRDDLEMKTLTSYSNRGSNIKPKKRKIVVLGKLGVGKTSLIKRYIDNVFPEKVPYQSEETFVKTILHKKEEVKLILLDTVGQNEYTPFLQSKYCIGVHAYILIFAINDENSFEAIQHINKLVLESVGCKYVPRIIIGNKSDLDTQREVSNERLDKFAKLAKAPYLECSSLKGGEELHTIISKLLNEIDKESNDQYPYNIKNSSLKMNFIRKNHNIFNIVLIIMHAFLILLSLIFSGLNIYIWSKLMNTFNFFLFIGIISNGLINTIISIKGIYAVKSTNYNQMQNLYYGLAVNFGVQLLIQILVFFPQIISEELVERMRKDGDYYEFIIISFMVLLTQIIILYISINLTPLYKDFQNSESANEGLMKRI